MELLSNHPHVTVCLVDRERIQFYHANHSVVLISSIIDLSLRKDGGGIDKLIAVLIAFRRLSLHDRRIMEPVQNATILRLEGNKELGGPIEVTLGTAIYLYPLLVGRSTMVVYGMSSRWPESRVVVKISWVDGCRVSEKEFMDKAVEEATKSGHEWALNHLPRFFYAEDVNDPTYRSVQELFKMAHFANREYTYRQRQMRIVVQEPLHPLDTLGNVRDIGQVILDTTCGVCSLLSICRSLFIDTYLVHRWLYDHPGIFHGDLNPNNIMYRIIEGQVHGVLTDYDLSSWKATLSSKQVGGSILFMAQEILKGTSPVHLYRHDVESLFYVMLIICGHHTISHTRVGSGDGGKLRVIMRAGRLPYQSWLEEPSDVLGSLKESFFSNMEVIKLSSSFEGFRMWLQDLQCHFCKGFVLKNSHELQGKTVGSHTDGLALFDDETLGGCIDYSTFIEPVRRLTGDLKGLVIRYDPLPYSPRALTNSTPLCD